MSVSEVEPTGASAPVSDGTSASILVDFDNVRLGAGEFPAEELSYQLVDSVRRLLAFEPRIAQISVRLYGGWYSGGVLTTLGSRVARAVEEVSLFPLADREARRIVRGSVELVDRLLAVPDIVLSDTYRRRGGMPRLRLSEGGHPEGCAGAVESCPVVTLHRFTKTKRSPCGVEGCGVTSDKAFVVHEQKMVDALMMCDLLEGAVFGGELVAVSTCDTDFLPALLFAATRSVGAAVAIFEDDCWSEEHLGFLEAVGLTTIPRLEAA